MILQRWLLTVTPVQGEVDPTAPGALQTVGSNEAGQIGDNTNLDRGEFTNIGALSWKSVATGASHVLALRSDNLLYGWGSNEFGQLGDSSLINRSSPVQIGTSSWSSISTKKNSSFGITADNKLFAWGFSQNGELGNQQRFDPNSFSSVSVAESHGLAIRSADNSLWAWGGNATGQLGDGTTVNKSFLTKIGSDSWLMISAGGANRSFGIKSDYTLWGWGGSYLGDGITVNRSSPVQINPLSGASSWTMVDAGIGSHSAGITTTGELYVWGGASSGQLGDGTTVLKSRATKIGTSSWTTVSCGDTHTLAIRNGGGMFAWGAASLGRLGLNSTSINRSSPVQIGTSSWIAVSAGEETSVAIRSDSTLWGWGSSTYVGDNTTIARSSPVQIGTSTWSKVSAGSYNTTFAIRSDNTMWAWGRNTDGQFGNNSVVSRSSPVQIGSGTWNVLPRPRQGAVTTSSSISAAIDGSGLLYQWGNNSITQIIDVNSAIQYSSPIQIGLGGYNSPVAIGSSSWTSVSAGTSRTYAIRSDGGLFAWGANDRGQLGDSTEIYRS
jgi:alpha-tubulin suppressor-like RCC1 family protein